MNKAKKDAQWAIRLLRGIEKKKSTLQKDQRASCHYWNGDSWGSISGIRDAAEWVDGELAKYILKKVNI